MRLIDADVVYETIKMIKDPDVATDVLEHIIATTPTAYDVNKVVEELEKYQKLCFLTMANTRDPQLDIIYEYVNSTIQEAIDIVRRGV